MFSGMCIAFTFACSETVDMMTCWVAIMNRGDWNEKIEGTFNKIAQVDSSQVACNTASNHSNHKHVVIHMSILHL